MNPSQYQPGSIPCDCQAPASQMDTDYTLQYAPNTGQSQPGNTADSAGSPDSYEGSGDPLAFVQDIFGTAQTDWVPLVAVGAAALFFFL